MAGLAKSISTLPVPAGDPSLIDRRNGRPKRITAKVKKAVGLLLNGEVTTLKAAAERAKVHPDYLSRSFRKPHVALFIDAEARARLATGKLAATSRLLQLLHADSEHVSFDAARHTLGINGIRPEPNENLAINLNVSSGYCIDVISDPRETLLDKHPLAPRTVNGDHQTNTASTAAPAARPRRPEPLAIPPFPDLVQTGVGRDGGPMFSYRAPNDREER